MGTDQHVHNGSIQCTEQLEACSTKVTDHFIDLLDRPVGPGYDYTEQNSFTDRANAAYNDGINRVDNLIPFPERGIQTRYLNFYSEAVVINERGGISKTIDRTTALDMFPEQNPLKPRKHDRDCDSYGDYALRESLLSDIGDIDEMKNKLVIIKINTVGMKDAIRFMDAFEMTEKTDKFAEANYVALKRAVDKSQTGIGRGKMLDVTYVTSYAIDLVAHFNALDKSDTGATVGFNNVFDLTIQRQDTEEIDGMFPGTTTFLDGYEDYGQTKMANTFGFTLVDNDEVIGNKYALINGRVLKIIPIKDPDRSNGFYSEGHIRQPSDVRQAVKEFKINAKLDNLEAHGLFNSKSEALNSPKAALEQEIRTKLEEEMEYDRKEKDRKDKVAKEEKDRKHKEELEKLQKKVELKNAESAREERDKKDREEERKRKQEDHEAKMKRDKEERKRKQEDHEAKKEDKRKADFTGNVAKGLTILGAVVALASIVAKVLIK